MTRFAVPVEHVGHAHHDHVVVVDERHGDRTAQRRGHAREDYLPRGVLLPPLRVVDSNQRRATARPIRSPKTERLTMIVLGIILLIAGFLLKISILWTIGIILLVIGAILAILGSTGRAVGGRRHYF
jgi:hypothetical protein